MHQSRRFQVYWLGQTLSGFGDAFALVALPLLVLEATHSIANMGLVSAAGVGAQVVTSLFSGTIVDRVDRRRLMVACDLGRACVYGTVPIAWWLQGPRLPLLFAIVTMGGVLSNIFSVAYVTAVPSLVSQDRLNSANARLQGSLALAYVFGSLGAGYLATAYGSVGALLIDAATFLISATSLTLIRFDAKVQSPEHQAERSRFGAGMRFLMQHRLLRTMTAMLIVLGLSGNMGVGAGITDLMIFHIRRELALDANQVGVCMGLSAMGAVLGAAVAPGIAKRIGSGICFLAGNFVQAVGLLLIGTLPHFAAACIGGLLWGAGMLMRGVTMYTLRQTLIPRDLLGRVTAISWTAVFGASAIGTAVVTRLAASWTAGTTLFAIGVGVALIGSVALLSPIASESRPVSVRQFASILHSVYSRSTASKQNLGPCLLPVDCRGGFQTRPCVCHRTLVPILRPTCGARVALAQAMRRAGFPVNVWRDARHTFPRRQDIKEKNLGKALRQIQTRCYWIGNH